FEWQGNLFLTFAYGIFNLFKVTFATGYSHLFLNKLLDKKVLKYLEKPKKSATFAVEIFRNRPDEKWVQC
ncbi:MAG: hypothetical protein K2I19_02785, partial [Muribaculaceae bacterium]|nr:hypothetical protein [Muribaculaceae bacterium]